MCRLGYAMREAAHLQDKSEETINRTEDCETRQSSQGLSDNSVKKFSVITFISLEKKNSFVNIFNGMENLVSGTLYLYQS